MSTIQQQFDSLVDSAFPCGGKSGMPQAQYNDAKRAYFAGYHAALCALDGLPDNDEEAVKVLDEWHQECDQFFRSLLPNAEPSKTAAPSTPAGG